MSVHMQILHDNKKGSAANKEPCVLKFTSPLFLDIYIQVSIDLINHLPKNVRDRAPHVTIF